MTYLESLIYKYKNKPIVIDTNIFLLLLIGTYNKKKIVEFKKTQKYSPQDFDYLMKLLRHFQLLTTPNILTEVVNHTETYNKQTKGELFRILKLITERCYVNYIESYPVMNEVFGKFGLTDSSIEKLSENYLILTDDFPLYGYLESRGKYVINFNHIRSEYTLGNS